MGKGGFFDFEYLDRLAEMAELPGRSFEERRKLVYEVYERAAPHYKGKNDASFKTYITACIKGAIRDRGGDLLSSREKSSSLEGIAATLPIFLGICIILPFVYI